MSGHGEFAMVFFISVFTYDKVKVKQEAVRAWFHGTIAIDLGSCLTTYHNQLKYLCDKMDCHLCSEYRGTTESNAATALSSLDY